MSGHFREAVMRKLWPTRALDPGTVWVILDGARDDQIFATVRDSGLNYVCLYSGVLPNALRMVAPYLVELNPSESFTGRLIDLAWGNSWGIFLKVRDASRLRHHLKGFLRVRSETGSNLVFRYYDPRVMRAYLPTCHTAELKTVFGPIQQYVVEGEAPGELIEFEFDGLRLETRKIMLAPNGVQPASAAAPGAA